MNEKWGKELLLIADFIPPGGEAREKLDVEKQNARIRELGFNGRHIEVTDITKGESGICFFDTEHTFEKKRDKLSEYRKWYKENGGYDIIYHNIHWLDQKLMDIHPEWFLLDEEGKIIKAAYGTGGYSCINSTFRDWSLGIIKDVGNYGVAGIFLDGPNFLQESPCYCEACHSLFEKQHGFRYTKENVNNRDVITKVYNFKKDSIVRFLKDARSQLESVNKDAVIYMNNSMFQPDTNGRCNRMTIKYQDALLAEGGFIMYDLRKLNLWKAAATAKLVETEADGKPPIIALKGSHGPWNYYLHTRGEIWNNYAMAVSNGANIWYGIYDYNRDDCKTDVIKEINTFLRRNETNFAGTSSTSRVALVWSVKCASFYQTTREDIDFEKGTNQLRNLLKGDVRKAFEGWFEILQQSQVIFDVLDDYHVENKDLSKYELIILPGIGCVGSDEGDRIRKYVAAGGNLIATFDVSLYDEYGMVREEMLLSDVFGITTVDGSEYAAFGHIAVEDGCMMKDVEDRFIPSPLHKLYVHTKENVQKTMYYREQQLSMYCDLPEKTEYPFIISNSFGRGKAVLIAGDMDSTYADYHFPVYGKIMKNLIFDMSTRRVFLDKGIPPLFVNIREKEGRQIIHLVNNTDFNSRPMEEICMLENLSIGIKMDTEPGRVTGLRSGGEIEFSYKEGILMVRIPAVKEYEILVVEFPERHI